MNSPLLTLTKPFIAIPSLIHHHHRPIFACKSTIDNNNTTSNDTENSPSKPIETANVRFRRGSRRKSRQKQQEEPSNGVPKKVVAPKDWDSMTLSEKVIELYVGEKGMLFWLNKFAYASIYIIIGAWILFRFVGPALNLYQLDTPPLSPTAILKG